MKMQLKVNFVFSFRSSGQKKKGGNSKIENLQNTKVNACSSNLPARII
jgi:hypothetical protein